MSVSGWLTPPRPDLVLGHQSAPGSRTVRSDPTKPVVLALVESRVDVLTQIERTCRTKVRSRWRRVNSLESPVLRVCRRVRDAVLMTTTLVRFDPRQYRRKRPGGTPPGASRPGKICRVIRCSERETTVRTCAELSGVLADSSGLLGHAATVSGRSAGSVASSQRGDRCSATSSKSPSKAWQSNRPNDRIERSTERLTERAGGR